MKLWIVRHAEAGHYNADPKKERERPLTALGRKQITGIAKKMKEDGENPKIIVASVFIRCLETADILGRILEAFVDPCDELSPHMPVEELVKHLVGNSLTKRVMLVGHSDNLNPYIAEHDDGHEAPPVLCKAEARRYDCDRSSAKLDLRYRALPSDIGLPNVLDYGKLSG